MADMTEPTQAQIEAAARALFSQENIDCTDWDKVGEEYKEYYFQDARVCLRAAAEVGEKTHTELMCEGSEKERLRAAAEVGDPYPQVEFTRTETEIKSAVLATIERCAQVVDNKAAEIKAWSHQDDASRLAAEMLRKVAAAIRALKDKP